MLCLISWSIAAMYPTILEKAKRPSAHYLGTKIGQTMKCLNCSKHIREFDLWSDFLKLWCFADSFKKKHAHVLCLAPSYETMHIQQLRSTRNRAPLAPCPPSCDCRGPLAHHLEVCMASRTREESIHIRASEASSKSQILVHKLELHCKRNAKKGGHVREEE